MSKLILLSIALAQIAIPLWASGDRDPRRGLRRALFFVVLFNFFYAFLLRVVVPRLG
jgi:hypothetical protein